MHLKTTQKTFFINGRFLTQPQTGVQRFARELLSELDQLIPDFPADCQFICLVPSREEIQTPAWKNIQVKPCGRLSKNLWEQIDLPFYARRGSLIDLCNIGPIFHFSQTIVIHDASVFAVPNAYSFSFRLKYKLIYQILARTSRQVITVSEFSRQELSRYLHMDAAKIAVISEGCEHILRIPPDDSVLEKFTLRKNDYFLVVGSSSRHKNLNVVFEAFASVKNEIPELVVAGGSFPNVFKEASTSDNPHVKRLGYVTDGQLRSLYENALGFIFPSLYEGFGLPPLEAMICGCPVICSNAASMPEVCGDAALYFDPKRPEEILQNIHLINDSVERRNRLISMGKRKSELNNWKSVTEKFITVLLHSLNWS